MAWVWCAAHAAWASAIGPVPDGYTFPVEDATVPDLFGMFVPLGDDGVIQIYSGDAAIDPCTISSLDGHLEYARHFGVADWAAGAGLSGAVPEGPWLYVIVGGPDYEATDPAPTWAPALALTGPLPTYEVNVVDVDGTAFGTLSDVARIGPIIDELNGVGGVTITLPTTHEDAELMLPGREVQIVYDNEVVFWGPIVRPQAGLRESTWQCQGPLWYFQHRYFGTADRANLILNGDFEDGEDDWTFEEGVSHSIETNPTWVLEGTQSLELNGSTADHIEHAQQIYTPVVQYHPLGDAVTVSAWVFIPSVGYLGGALDDRGLVVVRRALDGTAIDVQIAEIGDDTAKDEWVQLEVVVPSVRVDDTVEVRLYPPHGTGFFDLVTLTLMESLHFGGDDVGAIINGIVEYAQDLNPAFTHGKSDLNITADADTTGKIVTRTYLFSEHRNIAEAIEEFVRQGAVDIGFELTTTTRTLRVYNSVDAATGKGTAFATALDLATNLADFSWAWDGERAATSVVVLGPGDGPDRPEGGAADTGFLGGLTLELVESAPEDVTIGELDDWAGETLGVAKAPEIVEVTTMPGTPIPATGDTVTLFIVHGWLNVGANTYRVARREVDPYTGQARLTLNVVTS